MKRQCHLLIYVSALLTACGQNSRDATVERDSGLIRTDPATKRDLQESSPMRATTKDEKEVGNSFEQPWIPGQPHDGDYEERSRFSARARRFSNGRLILWLDTSLYRMRQTGPRAAFAVADSAVISGLTAGEFFTQYCRIGSGLADGQIGGLARTTVPERWERPRLGWVFDTVTSRIRSIPTDSVTCAVLEAD